MISVIIPVYNVAEYIEECISSVLNQSYRNFEVIIVDDCGTDNSMDLVHDMMGGKEDVVLKGIRFRIVRNERNMGLSIARNVGIEHATGDYLFFMDSDDTITDNCFSLLGSKAQETDADVVDARVCSVYPPGSDLPDGYVDNPAEVRKLFFTRKLHPEAWGRLIRRSLIVDNHLRFYPDIVSEDVLWGLQLFSNAKTMYCLPDKLYNYRMRPNSIMSPNKFKKRFDSFPVILKQSDLFARDNHFDNDKYFLSWIEYYKAVFFGAISNLGTKQQQRWFYKQVIRGIHRTPAFNKDGIHYLLPSFVGFYIYQRFYGRRLC